MDRSSEAFLVDLPRRISHHIRPGLPKYMVLRDAIAHGVATGVLPPGTRLPTEARWASELPLSLGTIQRALRMLADDGVVIRRQGSGTFVSGGGAGTMHAPMHCRFLNDDGTDYLPVYPKIVSRFETEEPGEWTGHLGCRRALCIERVLNIGKEFSIFSRFYIDPERIPAFSRLSIAQLSSENFKEIIMRETKQMIGRLNQFLARISFDQAVAELIGVPTGTTGQCLVIHAYVGRESAIYYQELWIPPNDRTQHLTSDGRDEGVFDC